MDPKIQPYEGLEPYIFISYARKDKDRVFPLIDTLIESGYRVWFDKQIRWTEDWADEIAERIDACTAFLAFHSAVSNVSRHCKAELYEAMSQERPLLSVYLEDGVKLAPGLRMYLRLWQSVKLSQFDTPEEFVARLGEEAVFTPCKVPEKHRIGQIQWQVEGNGVLTIEKNENTSEWYSIGSIPAYQWDPINDCSTAPWMLYRKQIATIVIADDIDAIGDFAFDGCKNLTNVHIGDRVTTIGNWAFAGCISLTSIQIPNGVEKIGENAFWGCKSVISMHIPNSVTEICYSAFRGCVNLKDVYIPDSVQKICEEAFSDCNSLMNVEIPARAKYVEDGPCPTFDEHICVTRRA